MSYFFEDVVVPIVVIGAVLAAVGAAMMGIIYICTAVDCASFEKATGTPTRMGGFACYVEHDGKVVPMDLYKAAYERNLSIKVKP